MTTRASFVVLSLVLSLVLLGACRDASRPSEGAGGKSRSGGSATRSPEAGRIGTASLNGDTVKLEDALAVWNERQEELHVYCFSFPLSEADRDKVAGFEAQAIAMSKEPARNPDPETWEKAPLVVFHFVFEDPKGPRTKATVRHSRFVSWMQRVPTTVNRRAAEAVERYERLEVVGEGAKRRVRLKTSAGEDFADRRFRWDVELDEPLLTVAK